MSCSTHSTAFAKEIIHLFYLASSFIQNVQLLIFLFNNSLLLYIPIVDGKLNMPFSLFLIKKHTSYRL